MSSITDFEIHSSPNVREFLADIAALGVSPVQEHSDASAYGVFGSRSNDRYWLLPLTPRLATRAGLAMFQPVSTSARLVRGAFSLAMRLHFDSIWMQGRLSVSGLPKLRADFGEPVAACAYFTGTAGPHRKTAIQAMTEDGMILGYGKLTRTVTVAPFVAAEASMLDQLAEMKLTSAQVPSKLFFGHTEGGVTLLVTDSRKSSRSQSPTVMGPAHLAFLRELDDRTGRTGDMVVAIALITLLEKAARHAVSPKWRKHFDGGIAAFRANAETMRTALAHGDFTPWNVFSDADGFYVFDWEYAVDGYPLGYDLVRFLLCSPSDKLALAQNSSVLDTLAAVHFDGDNTRAIAQYRASLLLHSAFYFDRAAIAGGVDWPEASRYAALLDVLSS